MEHLIIPTLGRTHKQKTYNNLPDKWKAKVKFTVQFRGREMQHTNLGKDLMDKIIEETKDIAKVESKPKFEGRQMVMIIQPL